MPVALLVVVEVSRGGGAARVATRSALDTLHHDELCWLGGRVVVGETLGQQQATDSQQTISLEASELQSLRDLVHQLTSIEAPPAVKDATVRSLRTVGEVPTGYVWPTLKQVQEAPGAAVVLVVAAGAVGKSAAAEAMAGSLNWPLVDASKAQVGSYSLSGLLHDALGFESGYIADIASGRAGIVIDALDEAHLRAGLTNFQEFLENIRRLGSAASEGLAPTVVIFSRPDTAEIVRLFFEESNSPLRVLEIDFFDYSQGCDYLVAYLDRLQSIKPSDPRYSVARKYPQPFGVLRDKRLSEVATALLTSGVESIGQVWPKVSEFLGYAPVLAVMAEFLAVSNPHAEASHDISEKHGARNILLGIIETLLDREQGKFQDAVIPKLLADLPADLDWHAQDQVYSPSEQGIRLASRYLDIELSVQPPAILPAPIRAAYENAASQFTADHPFLAGSEAVNVVFSDYILAKSVIDRDCLMHLDGDPRAHLRPVGPFFHHFVHQFGPRPREAAELNMDMAEIPDALIAPVLESHSKSVLDTHRSTFVYIQSGENIALLVTDNLSSGRSMLEYSIEDASGVFIAPSGLARGVIVSDGGIVLGQQGDRFILGPEMVIKCAELDIQADYLSVDGRGRHGNVAPCSIDAEEIRVVGKLTVDCPDARWLDVFGDVKWPSLRPYVRQGSMTHRLITRSSFVDLRAILKSFRQGMGASPSVFGELLDQRVIGGSASRQRCLDGLMQLGLVSKSGNLYYLNVDGLSKRGVNWHSYSDGMPSQSILALLAELDGKEGG